MMHWVKNIIKQLNSWLAPNPQDIKFEAEQKRIEALSLEEARTEFWSRAHQSQMDSEDASVEVEWEGLDLPFGVQEIFKKYNWIECGFQNPRIDREMVTPLLDNPSFIQIGATTDIDMVYIWRGEEGIFLISKGESNLYNKNSPVIKSIYHYILSSMAIYE